MICKTCNQEKIKYGTFACKNCRKAYEKQWNEKNRAHVNAKSREWCATNLEKRRATVRVFDSKHKEKRAVYHKNHYLNNKERYQDYVTQWRRVNPLAAKAIKQRYRSNLNNAFHIPYDRENILNKHNHTCVYCNGPAKGLDHVLSLSRGGPDTESNLVAACQPCNASKGSKHLHEWLRA